MKRNILYINLILLLGLFSCSEDILDKSPLDTLSEDTFWKTKADATAALSDCYDRWERYWTLYWLDFATDNGYSQFPWDGVQAMGNGSLTSESTFSSDMRNFYKFESIRKYNSFLTNIDKVDMDESEIKQMTAEVRFLRAYDYFWKVQFYGDVPLITKPLALDELTNVRDSKEDVTKFILDELDLAIADLKASYGPNNGRVNKAAALTLKSRILLYEGKFKESYETAELIMAMGYSLHSDYDELFTTAGEESGEIILSTIHIADKYVNYIPGYCYPNNMGGWTSLCPLQSLVDEYEMANGLTITEDGTYDETNPYINRDPRLTATIVSPGAVIVGTRIYNSVDATINGNKNTDAINTNNSTKTGYTVRKYMDFGLEMADIWNHDCNFIVFRYAEILLTYAEAKLEASNAVDNSIYDAIDAIRTRAGMPLVDRTAYSTVDKLRELIRRERRVELAYEGLRWFDIKRWDIGPDVLTGNALGCKKGTVIGGVNLDGDNYIVEPRKFNVATKYLLPIPQQEVIAIGTEQNAGY